MFYIVALGNPGDKYAATRHNIGWLVLDGVRTALQLPEPRSAKVFLGRHGQGNIANEAVMYLYPETYMNESGRAVKQLVPATDLSRVIVLHDDVALPFGEVKVSFGRGSGGQNGVQSIIDTVGSNEFIRIRIGIAVRSFWTGAVVRPTGASLARFVLAPLTKKEHVALEAITKTVALMLETIITEGHSVAMNRFN